MNERKAAVEKPFNPLSAWAVMILQVLLQAAAVTWVVNDPNPWSGITTVIVTLVNIVMSIGHFIVPPNVGVVLVLFGRYRGSVTREGFFWTNPFTVRRRISLKAHNLGSQTIKVNDSIGNPIEIAAVVVWQVSNTAQAVFDVEDYFSYVDVQIETAVRLLASRYPYDRGTDDSQHVTLRDSADQVNEELQQAIQHRLERAGIIVIEARISHLAYAPEIASAMLQRQQAGAIIAARSQIVEGAVGMVEHALRDLGEKGVVELDDERRATLVGNLLVVLCSHVSPTPVVNAGSLYN